MTKIIPYRSHSAHRAKAELDDLHITVHDLEKQLEVARGQSFVSTAAWVANKPLTHVKLPASIEPQIGIVTGTGTVVDFSTPQHTTYPYHGDMHAFTLSTESYDNRPFRCLYIEPKRQQPSAMSMMLTLSDVSPINTRVSCPITRGWSLVPHQFRGLVSHISPLKQYSTLVSTVRSNRYIDIDTIATEWWNHRSDVSLDHGLTSVSALPVLAI